jgi:hypothetical protein
MISAKSRARGRILAVVLSTVVLSASCRSAGGIGTLPPPPEQVRDSDYRPGMPLVEVSPGMAARTLFAVEATARSPYRVEVQDILVAPTRPPVRIPSKGAGLFEVRSGRGMANIGGRSQELRSGSTFSAGDGELLEIAALGDAPVALRVYFITTP